MVWRWVGYLENSQIRAICTWGFTEAMDLQLCFQLIDSFTELPILLLHPT